MIGSFVWSFTILVLFKAKKIITFIIKISKKSKSIYFKHYKVLHEKTILFKQITKRDVCTSKNICVSII